MFTKIDKKVIAEFDLCAAGPVIVGSGRINELDPTLPDITFLSGNNGKEETFIIPGSTIKGVIRYYIEKKNKDVVEFLFGKLGQKGRIAFHDAYADMKTVKTSERNQTAIDPVLQAAKNTSLRNLQTVEKGVFKAGFSIVNPTDEELNNIADALDAVRQGIIRFGGSTSRGFGQMNIENFKLTVTKGFDDELNPIVVKQYNSFEEFYKEEFEYEWWNII